MSGVPFIMRKKLMGQKDKMIIVLYGEKNGENR